MKGGSVHSWKRMGQLAAWIAALTSSRFRYACQQRHIMVSHATPHENKKEGVRIHA